MRAWTLARCLPLLWFPLLIAGCDEQPQQAPQQATSRTPQATSVKDEWIVLSTEWMQATNQDMLEVLEDDLEVAISRARQAEPRARRLWASTPEDQKDRWAVLWGKGRGSSILDPESPQIEYLWVIPIRWNQFRIEGMLASHPLSDEQLKPGELIAFASEDLADWIHEPEVGDVEGGYTIKVLRDYLQRNPFAR